MLLISVQWNALTNFANQTKQEKPLLQTLELVGYFDKDACSFLRFESALFVLVFPRPRTMKPMLTVIAIFFWGSTSLSQEVAKTDEVYEVWPKMPPTWNAPTEPERDTSTEKSNLVGGRPLVRLGNVSVPQMHVFRPAADKASDTTVVICPGGGYSILAWDLEGTEIAAWLNGIGVTAVVLKYRVPTRSENEKWLAPVQDIQRSISLIRSGSVKDIPSKQIGLLGFSAGGNASARSATATKRMYQPVDATDEAGYLPDFAVLIYPAWLVEKDNPAKLIDDIVVTKETPPMFFAHAQDDGVTCMSSVALFSALKSSGVPSSLHVFASGGHGFGARKSGTPDDQWPELCEAWMKSMKWLKN